MSGLRVNAQAVLDLKAIDTSTPKSKLTRNFTYSEIPENSWGTSERSQLSGITG